MRLSFYLILAFGAAAMALPQEMDGQRKAPKPYPASLYKPTGTILPSQEDAKLTEDEIIPFYKNPLLGGDMFGKRDDE